MYSYMFKYMQLNFIIHVIWDTFMSRYYKKNISKFSEAINEAHVKLFNTIEFDNETVTRIIIRRNICLIEIIIIIIGLGDSNDNSDNVMVYGYQYSFILYINIKVSDTSIIDAGRNHNCDI